MAGTIQEVSADNQQDQDYLKEQQLLHTPSSDERVTDSSGPSEGVKKTEDPNPIDWEGPDDPVRPFFERSYSSISAR